MLAGILTTALEIVIVLDICGALVYCVVSGLARQQKADADNGISPLEVTYAAALQPCPAGGAIAPPPSVVCPPGGEDLRIYATPEPTAEPQQEHGLAGAFRRHIDSLRKKFTYRPGNGTAGVRKDDMDEANRKLGRVLDSFKEDV